MRYRALHPDVVKDIRARLARGESCRTIALAVGVSAGMVCKVRTGKKHQEIGRL
jgi:hypothetical protein